MIDNGYDNRTVYQVARWAEVFETAESRKYKRLNWIAERTDFNSTGWQQGLEHFGSDGWLVVYAAWMVIVRVAATSKTRGQLSGDKGEPYTASRIARPAGVSSERIQTALDFAVSIGWLVPAEESPGDFLQQQEKNIATGPDRTEQNKTTGPVGNARSGPVRDFRALLENSRGKALPSALYFEFPQSSAAPERQRQCWTEAAGWSDGLVKLLADPHSRSMVRLKLLNWWLCQAGAPDPIASDRSAAAVVVALSVAEEAATRAGISNRVAWFRAAITDRLKGLPLSEIVRDLPARLVSSVGRFVADQVPVQKTEEKPSSRPRKRSRLRITCGKCGSVHQYIPGDGRCLKSGCGELLPEI